MTERDPVLTTPACPLCGSSDDAKPSPKSHLGRWLCVGCMFLYEGTTAEWNAYASRREAT